LNFLWNRLIWICFCTLPGQVQPLHHRTGFIKSAEIEIKNLADLVLDNDCHLPCLQGHCLTVAFVVDFDLTVGECAD
jgi:hypothetical protein